MKRREFLKAAGLGAAASAVAAPAIAQSMPAAAMAADRELPASRSIRCTAAAEIFAKRVAEVDRQPLPDPGVRGRRDRAAVPGCRRGAERHRRDVRSTASYYFLGKDLTFALPCAVPFGLNARMQNAWQHQGGGIELMNEFFKKYNIYALPCGNTGARWAAGSARRSRRVADLNGLKIPHRRLCRPHAVASSAWWRSRFPAGEIYPALEKGTHRRRRMGRPVRRREARLLQGGAVLLLSRLVGRRHAGPHLHQSRQVERAAAGLPGGRAQRRPTRPTSG